MVWGEKSLLKVGMAGCVSWLRDRGTTRLPWLELLSLKLHYTQWLESTAFGFVPLGSHRMQVSTLVETAVDANSGGNPGCCEAWG